ncbi:phage tail tape measure protein [Salmonella enterica]|nr:phage tail tape measure protein [Salmonella enterica]EDJ5815724.1 phage tail tape measure protein [Salmonella enterica]EIA3421946.1 phage tail tape measure protein [Salmonella enterica]EIE8488180.1 phage tail tape measure protein [Salmonella enterica]EII0823324.1 phage tail tape measure protein [Salmonella enterica]
MASNFSVGVVIGGMIGSTFRSAMSGTRRALDSLNDTSRRLQERQDNLTQKIARYGHLGTSSMQNLNNALLRVGRTMEQVERQQRRLSAASATSDALKANRRDLYSQGAETAGIAMMLGAPVLKSVKQYASFESQLRDIGVTGDLNKSQELQIGNIIRQKALETNQYQETLMEGIGTLVAAGQEPLKAAGKSGLLGKTATASGADINDLAKMSLAFESLRITDNQELEKAFNRAVFGGKAGRFELKDMAQYLPEMAQQFAGKGIFGQEALSQIIASLEVGREGAGSEGEAATNMRNWLASMGRGDIARRYANAGLDYQNSMSHYVSAGKSQYEASILIADRFIKSKGKEFLSQWEKAGARGDREAQQTLMESFGLSSIFTDVQTVNHLLAMRQRWGDYQKIKEDMNGPTAQNSINTDFEKKNDTLEARWRRTQIGFNESAISIGESLRPALIQLGETFIPLINSVGKWIAAHPQLVSGTIKVVGALLAFKMATIGLKLGLNLLFSPFTSVWKNVILLRTNWLRLNVALAEGGKLRWLVTGFSAVARGARTLGGVLSGGLVRGIMIAGRAVLWIGRALLMNPIGLAITAVAAAAYLIYRNWGAVSSWFKQRWADIKEAFNGGIVGIGKLLINWSPVGLLYKAFATALKYLGVDLPAKFTDFGGHLIDGLINGIKNKWESLKTTVTDMGDSVGGWFKEKLGIHSPSRVFMGFGDNIAQGAAIGLQRTTPLAALAGQRLAAEMTPDVPRIPSPEIMAAGYSDRGAAAAGGGTSGGIQVSFNPQFFLNGKETAAPAGLTGALNMSLHELEKMLERLLAQKQRRGYE